MSDLDLSGPAQPPKSEVYNTAGNPTTHNPAERAAANLGQNQGTAEVRGPFASHGSNSGDAIPAPLARGVRGGGPMDSQEARETQHFGDEGRMSFPQNYSVDAQKMAPPGEGQVADAVGRKAGAQKAPGENTVHLDDYTSELDRKKDGQASAREEIQEARKTGVNVDDGAYNRRTGVDVD